MIDIRVLTGLNWLRIGSNYRLCEHSGEYFGSLKGCESIGKLHFCRFLKKDSASERHFIV
jgi:hypothetical protein